MLKTKKEQTEESPRKGPWDKPHKCKYCSSPATRDLIWAEGRAYIPVCGQHRKRGEHRIEVKNHDKVAAAKPVVQEERAARCGAVAATSGRTKPTDIQKRRKRYKKGKTMNLEAINGLLAKAIGQLQENEISSLTEATRIKWKRSEEGYVDSKDGMFEISPLFMGRTTPMEFEVHMKIDGKRKKIGKGDTQKEAKETAQDWLDYQERTMK